MAGADLKHRIKGLFPESAHLMMDVAFARATWPIYAGSRRHCPVCGGNFRRFLPHFGIREQARCPRCRSYERHRLLWLYLRERTNILKDKLRVLHLAPEYVLQKKLRPLPNLVYTSADLYSPIAMVRADITKMQFADASFDVVLCYHVLEHIPDDRAAMAEMFRVMAPGGWAIIQVPMGTRPTTHEDITITDPKERQRLFGQEDHVRAYGLDYKDRLEAAGFAVEVDDYVRKMPKDEVERMGLLADEDIYLCRRAQ